MLPILLASKAALAAGAALAGAALAFEAFWSLAARAIDQAPTSKTHIKTVTIILPVILIFLPTFLLVVHMPHFIMDRFAVFIGRASVPSTDPLFHPVYVAFTAYTF
jgi:hypothetical protein